MPIQQNLSPPVLLFSDFAGWVVNDQCISLVNPISYVLLFDRVVFTIVYTVFSLKEQENK